MPRKAWKLPVTAAVTLAFGLAACSSAETVDPRRATKSNITSRWQPPESSASGTYEGLNGEGCSGGLKPGTKQLGDQLKSEFNTAYGGYACRANTADTSQLSIHAVGRALDVTASGSKGDEIANHLVENATALGIQLIIWNHTLWKITPTGATSRQYTGPNPHTDHVHAEVTTATAQNGPGAAQSDPNGKAPNDPNGGDVSAQDPNAQGPAGGADPMGGSPNGQGPSGDDSGPWGPGGEEEMECRTNLDCDPSGQVICDQGFCFW